MVLFEFGGVPRRHHGTTDTLERVWRKRRYLTYCTQHTIDTQDRVVTGSQVYI
jgi:hypothetical protein